MVNVEELFNMAKSINQTYANASGKNSIINENKITLYKYIKWPQRYPLYSQGQKTVLIGGLSSDIDKQIKAFKILDKSLSKVQKLLDKNKIPKNAPEIYNQYVGLVESSIHETQREITRLIDIFESEASLIKSGKFKDFANKTPEELVEGYQSFITIFDQERRIYKTLSFIFSSRYQEYTHMATQVQNYAKTLEENRQNPIVGAGVMLPVIGSFVFSIIMVGAHDGFSDPSAFLNIGFSTVIIGSFTGILGGIVGLYIAEATNILEDAQKVIRIYD
jgi:hypothetical protein